MKYYRRTCQECGKDSNYAPPPVDNTVQQRKYWKWAAQLCKFCKSESLDYGSWTSNKTSVEFNEAQDEE